MLLFAFESLKVYINTFSNATNYNKNIKNIDSNDNKIAALVLVTLIYAGLFLFLSNFFNHTSLITYVSQQTTIIYYV